MHLLHFIKTGLYCNAPKNIVIYCTKKRKEDGTQFPLCDNMKIHCNTRPD